MICEPVILKRSVAKAMGLLHYHNGKPCPAGHFSERFVSTGTCRACIRIKTKEWQAIEENKRWNRRYASEWAQAHPQQCARNKRAWSVKNAASLRVWRAKYAKGRVIERRLAEARRRVRKHKANGTHNSRQIRELLIKQKHKCPYCKSSLKNGYHIDHIYPLVLGGSNAIDNIQLLCPPCNLRKSIKSPERFAQEIGLLL
jgi:5-methylcytosine-specific restriction endonuclease McrA